MRLRGRRFERSWLGPAKELLQSYLNHPPAARRSRSGGDAKRPAALEFGNRCELLNRLQTRPDIACELAYRTHLVGGLAWKIWRAQGQLGREQYPGNCARNSVRSNDSAARIAIIFDCSCRRIVDFTSRTTRCGALIARFT